jgi:hypothetical protein
LQRIQKPVVAEIGVDNGKTSKKLLSMHPRLFLYMVDWWQPPPADSLYAKSDASIVKKDKEYFKLTYKNCKNIAFHYPERTRILRGDCIEMAQHVKDGMLDLAFIDSDHSYEGCKAHILAWLHKVKKGGWIGGHDYNHPDQGEVKKAVNDIFSKDEIKLGDNRTWWVRI